MMKRILSRGYLLLLLALLYAPIIVIAVFSFTEAKVMGNWTGFSTGIYEQLFSGKSVMIMKSVENTLLIALIAAAVATLLGGIAAIGIYNMRHRQRRMIQFVNNIPMLNPDIITGVSLFVLFVFMGFTQGLYHRDSGARDLLYALRRAERHAATDADEPQYIRGCARSGRHAVSGAQARGYARDTFGHDIGFHTVVHAVDRRLRRHVLHEGQHRSGNHIDADIRRFAQGRTVARVEGRYRR